MSFANIDLESQTVSGGKSPLSHTVSQTQTQTELDKIISNTSNQLQTFGNLISQFEAQRKSIGTKRDNVKVRESLDSLTGKLTDLQKAIRKLLANISALINKNSDEKSDKKFEITNKQIVIQERLLNEYSDLHRQYTKSFKEYNDRKRVFPLIVDETTPLVETKQSPPSQRQSQQQVQQQAQNQDIIDETELQYHRMLTEERNREIEQAAEGIMEVNSIFKDLGALVHQQGEQLDLVEDNIAQLGSNTQQASRELTKANEYQRKKGKWSCILLIALCIFVLVVVLAVVS